VFHAVKTQARAVEDVGLYHRQLGMVVGGPHAEALRRFHGGGEGTGAGAAEFDAIGAALAHGPHPGAGSLGGGRVRREHGVDAHARGADLAGGGAFAMRQGPAEPHHGTDVAHRGHAVGEPQLEHVFRVRQRARGGVGRRAQVDVRVDEARQHVATGGVDDFRIRGCRRPIASLDGDDAVPLDSDGHGAPRGRAGAVDKHGIGDEQALEGAPCLLAARRRRRRRRHLAAGEQCMDRLLARLRTSGVHSGGRGEQGGGEEPRRDHLHAISSGVMGRAWPAGQS
jgi:hypothetical protein